MLCKISENSVFLKYRIQVVKILAVNFDNSIVAGYGRKCHKAAVAERVEPANGVCMGARARRVGYQLPLNLTSDYRVISFDWYITHRPP